MIGLLLVHFLIPTFLRTFQDWFTTFYNFFMSHSGFAHDLFMTRSELFRKVLLTTGSKLVQFLLACAQLVYDWFMTCFPIFSQLHHIFLMTCLVLVEEICSEDKEYSL